MLVPFEEDNVAAYRLLLRIETAVRELLRLKLATKRANWLKELPPDLRTKILEERDTSERRVDYGHVKLGPLYYLTFGELVQLCQRKPPSDILTSSFGSHALEDLQALVPIRNAIAHGRRISDVAKASLEVAYARLQTAIGQEAFRDLCRAPDVGLWPDEGLRLLRGALVNWAGINCVPRARHEPRDTRPSFRSVLVGH